MPSWCLVFLATLVAWAPPLMQPALAQLSPDQPVLEPYPPPPASLEFLAIEEVLQNTNEPQLGKGTVVNPKDWPASFYAEYTVPGGRASCSSTLVGARALLTAAHCVADGGSVSLEREGKFYTGRCENARPGYPQPMSADWSLCLMQEDVPAYLYETISLSTAGLGRDGQLLLTGFGCQKIGGVSDRKFRTGPAFVEWPVGTVTGHANWLATHAAANKDTAFICPGDSGGAVYRKPEGGERILVAVESHYDTAGQGVSFLSVLSTPAGADFLRGWAQRHGQRLCGIHADAPNCRR